MRSNECMEIKKQRVEGPIFNLAKIMKNEKWTKNSPLIEKQKVCIYTTISIDQF